MTPAEQFKATMRAQIEARPPWRFICERDWLTGPDVWALGFIWDRNFDAEPGEFVYRSRFIIRLTFRCWVER